MNKLSAGFIAEFIGTFALVFFGAGSILMAAGHLGAQRIEPSAGLVTIALAHGIALFVFITGSMYISGGQFNPAVSFGLVVAGKQSPAQAGAYIVAQLLGAISAAALLQFIVGRDATGTWIANDAGVKLGATIGKLTELHDGRAVIITEGIATFALMFAVLAATVDERAHKLGGLVIGLTVTMCILAIGPLTGGSMNPARTLGPALVGGHWEMHWAYWIGPLAGAGLCAVVYREVWVGRGKA
jgi:MIP family channel proteins